jgi:hypothetical protein
VTPFQNLGAQADHLIRTYGPPAAILVVTSNRNQRAVLANRINSLSTSSRTLVDLLVACAEEGHKNFHFHVLIWQAVKVYDKIRNIMRVLEADDVCKVLIDKEYRAFRHDPSQIVYRLKTTDGKLVAIPNAPNLDSFPEIQQEYVKIKVCYSLKRLFKGSKVITNGRLSRSAK